MKVTVLGARGFVGSAFVAYLSNRSDVEVCAVTRDNYASFAGARSDVVIDAAGNSKKYLADERPVDEFKLSVNHRLCTLFDFPTGLSLHLSSVDVYSDLSSPATTQEDTAIDLARVSHYGLHKLLAEELVRHYADRWLIVRLAGMVGPGLRKNPVHDILRGQPLRIHPDSQYQFMGTDDVARTVWRLVEQGLQGEVYNVCGTGLISPREIARLAGLDLKLDQIPTGTQPRVVHASTEKIAKIAPLPKTGDTICRYIGDWSAAIARKGA